MTILRSGHHDSAMHWLLPLLLYAHTMLYRRQHHTTAANVVVDTSVGVGYHEPPTSPLDSASKTGLRIVIVSHWCNVGMCAMVDASNCQRFHVSFYFLPWTYHSRFRRYSWPLIDVLYPCGYGLIISAWHIDWYPSYSTPISCCVEEWQKIAATYVEAVTQLHMEYTESLTAPLNSTWKTDLVTILSVWYTLVQRYYDGAWLSAAGLMELCWPPVGKKFCCDFWICCDFFVEVGRWWQMY